MIDKDNGHTSHEALMSGRSPHQNFMVNGRHGNSPAMTGRAGIPPSPGVGGGGLSMGLTHIEKLNMRLRARNTHAQQNNSMASPGQLGSLNVHGQMGVGPMIPMPLSQRSFSPPQHLGSNGRQGLA